MVATGAQEKNQPALDTLQALGIDCAYVQGRTSAAPMTAKKFWTPRWLPLGGWTCWSTTPGVAPKVRADLLDMSEESFDYVVGINTKGNMFLTQLVAKQMIAQEPVDGTQGRDCQCVQLQLGGVLHQPRRILRVQGGRVDADDSVRRPPCPPRVSLSTRCAPV